MLQYNDLTLNNIMFYVIYATISCYLSLVIHTEYESGDIAEKIHNIFTFFGLFVHTDRENAGQAT